MSASRAAELVRKALGCGPEVPIEIDNVQRWSATAACAANFRRGRVFLAGDSAHVMPPTGGFGGNTGVADAYNLVWKLAMVVNGAAGPELLDTYDTERRPVCELIVEQAYTRYVLRVDSFLPQDDLMTPLDDASIELGAVYRSAAVFGSEDPAADEGPVDDPRKPMGRPGTRAPHVPLARHGESISTHDVFGRGFVLLAGASGQEW